MLLKVKPVFVFWRTILAISVPLIALPMALHESSAMNCAYVMVIMASYWVTEAIPLAVTGIIPVVLFPVLGIMTTDEVSREYTKQTNLLFMSCIMVAIAIENSNLHTRIALKILLSVGTSLRRLMFGFMICTMFFSMWIFNAAATAMMLPIADEILNELESKDLREVEDQVPQKINGEYVVINDLQLSKKEFEDKEKQRMNRVMMYLAIAYASNIGGTGTLAGNGGNVVLKGILDASFEYTPVTFASWMVYAVPSMIVSVLVVCVYLQFWFLGRPKLNYKRIFSCGKLSRDLSDEEVLDKARGANVKRLLMRKYKELGRLTFHESAVLVLFVFLICLWFTRDPAFLTGWGSLVKIDKYTYIPTELNCTSNCTYTQVVKPTSAIGTASAGILIVILMFIIPATLKPSEEGNEAPPSLLNWPIIHQRFPWGLILLIGGGYTIAAATKKSGLSDILAENLIVLDFLDKRVLILVLMFVLSIVTEVTSNAAIISITLPIIRDLAISLSINPLYLMAPLTTACCFAFMLPGANPPNAIVYTHSDHMKISDMLKCGFFVNVICIAVHYVCLNTYGVLVYNLNEFPAWALE